jgi:hypothetical protein
LKSFRLANDHKREDEVFWRRLDVEIRCEQVDSDAEPILRQLLSLSSSESVETIRPRVEVAPVAPKKRRTKSPSLDFGFEAWAIIAIFVVLIIGGIIGCEGGSDPNDGRDPWADRLR